ncbi:MAG: cupin domain-containing protein [Kiritimatiellia bacterium]|nr:cupin domain-containing protein [Kiritimatiellia bacterium]
MNRIWIGILIIAAAGCGTLPDRKNADLSTGETSIHKTEVEVLAKSGLSWDGARLPDYPQGHPEVTLLRIVIPAGETLAMHKHPVINAGVLLRGELTVRTEDGKTLHLRAGEALVEVVDTWHYGKNEGSEDAEIIVFYAGVEGSPLSEYKPSEP